MIKNNAGDFMDSTNKTLYIPLYGKALVSRKGMGYGAGRADKPAGRQRKSNFPQAVRR